MSRTWRAAIVAAGLSLTCVLGPLLTAGPASAAAVPAEAGSSSLQLAGQTAWVRGRSGLELQLRVSSALPVAQLELKFVLYSRLVTRSAFAQSLTGNEPASELPVDAPPPIPLGDLDHRSSPNGSVTLKFPVSPVPVTVHSLDSPTLNLSCGGQCDGVYPLEAALIDATSGAVLATLTTHVIYTASTSGLLPLDVALVLPSGTSPALNAADAPVLSQSRLRSIERVLAAVVDGPNVPLTFAVYPQLLVALERDRSPLAQRVLSLYAETLRPGPPGTTTPPRELLGTTFTPVNVRGLTTTGLGGELTLQFARGIQALDAVAKRHLGTTPYIATGALDRQSLSVLEQNGVRQIVVAATNITPPPPAPSEVLTSPFILSDSTAVSTGASRAHLASQGPVAFAADPALAAHFSDDAADPVLAAHQLLADLAEIYFDAPFAQNTRGVVIAPSTWQPNAEFLHTLLSALAHSPIVRPVTLGQAFELRVGGNGTPRNEQLAAPARATTSLDASAAVSARATLQLIRTITPSNGSVLARLSDAILMAETSDIAHSTRLTYDDAPQIAVGRLRGQLSFFGSRRVTLTSASGQKIPVTLVSTSPYPVHAVLELRDSDLVIPRDEARVPVTLSSHTTTENFSVSTRTSGATTLQVVLLDPSGSELIASEKITIVTTAVSGVAIALSIGALLVLAGWWIRSILRHRRQAQAARRSAELSNVGGNLA